MSTTSLVNNITSLYVSDNIRKISDDIQKTTTRLASGNQITKASDDPAGASIGLGLKIKAKTIDSAITTAGQAQGILDIADGGTSDLLDIVERLKSLATQANSGALGAIEKGYIQNEINALVSQISTVISTATFGDNTILDGSYTSEPFQVGSSGANVITISFGALDAATLGINNLDVVNDVSDANNSLDNALSILKTARAQIGALESRFNSVVDNLESTKNSLIAASGEYLEADFAEQARTFAEQQNQFQAAIAIAAQVNQLPAGLLKLVG